MRSRYSSGALLGPYELVLPLSQTGAAEVWVARLIGTGAFRAHVVLKAIPRACFDDLPTEQLLLEQSALAARIRHPNLVEVQDLGEQGDTLYLALEWVDGVPLRVLLDEAAKQGRLPLPIAVSLIAQLCRGLHAIHELRDEDGTPLDAVHGHVSPRNLLVGYNGIAKLCDFGIARVLDRLSFLTGASEHSHKLTFAAPEQLSGGRVDRRSDVFCVGTLLYLLASSRHPFEGADVRATLQNICSNQPAPALDPAADRPESLCDIVAMALSKSPHARFGSALELLDALEATMPDCFQAGSEQALASYVEALCAPRKSALRARIHAVELQHERARSSRPPGARNAGGSLPAVTMDPTASDSDDRRSLRPAAGLPELYRSNLRRVAPLALGLPVAFLVCLGLWRGLASPERNRPSTAFAPEVVTMQELGVRSLPVAASATPTLAATPSQSATLPITPIETLPTAPRAAQVRRSAPRNAAPTPAASSTPAPAKLNEQAKANAWDPSTFGGRY